MKNVKKYFAIFAILTLGMVRLDAATDYAQAYTKLAAVEAGTGNTVEALKAIFSTGDFNHKNDTDVIRSSMSGLYARKAFIKLSDADFVDVVNNRLPFFSKLFGFSLIHGWMLNKFKDPTIPCYIDKYFSFDKFFSGMAMKMPADVQNIVMRVWQRARDNIINDAKRWDYYDHMLYLPYAIEQANTGAKNATAPDMDLVIQNATRSVKWTGITLLKSNGDPVRSGEASKLEEKGVYMTPIDWTALNATSINRMNKDQLIDILQTWKAILGPTALKCGLNGGIPSPTKGIMGVCKIENAEQISEYIADLSSVSPNLQDAIEYMTKDHGLFLGKGNGNRIQLMIETLKNTGYAS